jgi:hypothetical protein
MHVVSHQANWNGKTALIYPKNYEFWDHKAQGSLIVSHYFESRNCCNSSSDVTWNSNFCSCSRLDSDAHQWIVFFSPDSNPWYVAILLSLLCTLAIVRSKCWRKNPYDKGPRFRLSNSASESTLVQAYNLKPSLPFDGFWPF